MAPRKAYFELLDQPDIIIPYTDNEDIAKNIKILTRISANNAKLENGIAVYKASTAPKMFTQIDFHRHVRAHTQMPFQYRLAYEKFLMDNGLIAKGTSAEVNANPEVTAAV